MTDPSASRDYSKTLFLPVTDFPMRAGLPKKEPEIIERWEKLGLYQRLRADAKGRLLLAHELAGLAECLLRLSQVCRLQLGPILCKHRPQSLALRAPQLPTTTDSLRSHVVIGRLASLR